MAVKSFGRALLPEINETIMSINHAQISKHPKINICINACVQCTALHSTGSYQTLLYCASVRLLFSIFEIYWANSMMNCGDDENNNEQYKLTMYDLLKLS